MSSFKISELNVFVDHQIDVQQLRFSDPHPFTRIDDSQHAGKL